MWICIKHDCSGMVGDECPHCATARLLCEERQRLLKSFPVDCKVSDANGVQFGGSFAVNQRIMKIENKNIGQMQPQVMFTRRTL